MMTTMAEAARAGSFLLALGLLAGASSYQDRPDGSSLTAFTDTQPMAVDPADRMGCPPCDTTSTFTPPNHCPDDTCSEALGTSKTPPSGSQPTQAVTFHESPSMAVGAPVTGWLSASPWTIAIRVVGCCTLLVPAIRVHLASRRRAKCRRAANSIQHHARRYIKRYRAAVRMQVKLLWWVHTGRWIYYTSILEAQCAVAAATEMQRLTRGWLTRSLFRAYRGADTSKTCLVTIFPGLIDFIVLPRNGDGRVDDAVYESATTPGFYIPPPFKTIHKKKASSAKKNRARDARQAACSRPRFMVAGFMTGPFDDLGDTGLVGMPSMDSDHSCSDDEYDPWY